MYYVIDTDIVIDHLRGEPAATNFLQRAEEGRLKAFISVITEYELLCSPKLSFHEEKKISELITKVFPSLSVTSHIVKTAAFFHRKYTTNFADALIAATAHHTKAILVTRNIKHFCSIKEINITSPSDVHL